jgi:hypothetical protein
MFQSLQVTNASGNAQVGWFGTATLQSVDTLTGSWTNLLSLTNTLNNTYTPATPKTFQFFRLQYPPLP